MNPFPFTIFCYFFPQCHAKNTIGEWNTFHTSYSTLRLRVQDFFLNSYFFQICQYLCSANWLFCRQSKITNEWHNLKVLHVFISSKQHAVAFCVINVYEVSYSSCKKLQTDNIRTYTTLFNGESVLRAQKRFCVSDMKLHNTKKYIILINCLNSNMTKLA